MAEVPQQWRADVSVSEAAKTHNLQFLGCSWIRAQGSYPGNWVRLISVLLHFQLTFTCEQSQNLITPSPLAAEPNSGMNFHPRATWFCSHQFHPVLSLLPSLQKAIPDWEHSIQRLPGEQEWFTSAGDWTRLCLALGPRFRNNNVMNNPFMFIHLV